MLKFLAHLPGDLRETSLALGAMQFAIDKAPVQIDFSAVADDPLSIQLIKNSGHVRLIPSDDTIGNPLTIAAARNGGVHIAKQIRPTLEDSAKYGEEEGRRIVADLMSIDPSSSPPDIKGLMIPYGYCVALMIRDALQELGYYWDFHNKVDNYEILPYAAVRRADIRKAEQLIKTEIVLEDNIPVKSNSFIITDAIEFKEDMITQLYEGVNPSTIYPLFLEDWKINGTPISLPLLIGLIKHSGCVATISTDKSFLNYLAAACKVQHITLMTGEWPSVTIAATTYPIDYNAMKQVILPQLGIILADIATKQDKLLIRK